MKIASAEANDMEPNWADVFATFLSHTSMSYDEITERTIPQLEAIMAELGKHINLKRGITWETGIVSSSQPKGKKGKAPKLSELAAFCGNFKA